ncbi:hypothetical protein BDZ97DRAFT_1625731, partial [Flammula alnicola]
TPLIFFSPRLAYQISVATYIHTGSTAVLIWDIIDNLGNDFKLLYSYKIRLPTVLYFTTRISLLVCCLGKAVLLTIPVDDCSKLENTLNAFLIIYAITTTALFYLRMCAVYAMNKYIVTFFSAVWLATAGMISTFAKTFSAAHVGPTRFCGESVKGNLLGPTSLVLVANDGLVYFAIAYRIIQMFPSGSDTLQARFNLLAFGRSLPLLSKALIKGQSAVLSTFCNRAILATKTLLGICAFAFDEPINAMFIIAHLVLVNILSCRVFRNIKMGV